MSYAVRQLDLHLLFGYLVLVPHSKVYHRGQALATLGSITIPPVIPGCCSFICGTRCCVPNISVGTSKVYINGLPSVKTGNLCIPCGTPALALQTHLNIV